MLGFLCFLFCGVLSVYFLITDAYPYWACFLYAISTCCFYFLFIPKKALFAIVKKYKADLILSGVFILLSLCLYLFRIAEITPGVWGDEVALGPMTDYLKTLGSFTPFISYNLGHPTPLIYLSSFFISILGKNILSLRIVSILFGSVSVGLFYLFLRSHYSRFLAIAGSVLFATSYIFIIVTRFAYEMSAAIFFLIASSYLLLVFIKKPTERIIVFLGLSLSAGLYTYLAFRTIVLVFIGILLVFLLRKNRSAFRYMCLFFMSFMVVVMPLVTFSFRHFDVVNQRVQALSVFNQNLPKNEVMKELEGAAIRTFGLFATTGDPNPRQNPANTVPFDYGTLILFFIGIILLLKNKPRMGLVIILVILTVLLTEIVTLEKIPEFHYYGLGHPNTLRISPLVPVVLYVVVYGLQQLQKVTNNKIVAGIGIITFVLLVSAINIHRYYFQKMTPWIYTTNFVPQLRIIDTLNRNKPDVPVAVSPSLYTSPHVQFFLDTAIKLVPLPFPIDCSFTTTNERISIVMAQDLVHCTNEQLQTFMQNASYRLTWMINPWNTYDALILFRAIQQ